MRNIFFFSLEGSQLCLPESGASHQQRPDPGRLGWQPGQEVGRRPLQQRVHGRDVLRRRLTFESPEAYFFTNLFFASLFLIGAEK